MVCFHQNNGYVVNIRDQETNDWLVDKHSSLWGDGGVWIGLKFIYSTQHGFHHHRWMQAGRANMIIVPVSVVKLKVLKLIRPVNILVT
jgi:hypothetical protein